METGAPMLGEPLPVELMNTIWADRDGVHDALSETTGAMAWLQAVAPRLGVVTGPEPGARDDRDTVRIARQLVTLRDALRRLAAEATGDPRPGAASAASPLGDAVSAVNRASATVPRWLALAWAPGGTPTRLTRTGGHAAAAAISVIAEEAISLLTQDSRLRLRACLAPGCVLYFLKDHPRREWCSASCGNRARAARHYQRHRRSTA
jgi:predicted RNA-binding Zn ribbon-like protein